MIDHMAIGYLLVMRGRAIEGRGERVQQGVVVGVSIFIIGMLGMRQIVARELLDQDLILGHSREQIGNARAQSLLNIVSHHWHHAFGAEEVAGVLIALPLAVHHLHVLGLIETIFAANPGFGKFLQDAQVQCATETVARHSKHGGIVFAPLVEH